jgi:hypothetical protein
MVVCEDFTIVEEILDLLFGFLGVEHFMGFEGKKWLSITRASYSYCWSFAIVLDIMRHLNQVLLILCKYYTELWDQ